jgi:predicted transcriptional regulator
MLKWIGCIVVDMPREHGEHGDFVETTTVEDVYALFDTVEGPVLLSGDVVDHLDCSISTARNKLQRLYDQGRVERRKRGQNLIYWRTDEEGAR